MNSAGTCLAQMGAVPSRIPICLVMTSFEPGGTGRQLIGRARRLDPGRWAVPGACFHGRGAWFDGVGEIAASVAEFPVTTFRSPSAARHMWPFARWCGTRQMAVVHTTELYSN